MEGIRVVLYLPDSQRSTTTNRQGLATFEDVPSIDLPLVRLKNRASLRLSICLLSVRGVQLVYSTNNV